MELVIRPRNKKRSSSAAVAAAAAPNKENANKVARLDNWPQLTRDANNINTSTATAEFESQSPTRSKINNNDTPATEKEKEPKKRFRKPIIITPSSYAQWLTKPWSNKNTVTKQIHSGPHRKFHGVIPHQTSDGTFILMCTLCKGKDGKGMILPPKFGQHFATAKHWNKHLKLLEENGIAENSTVKNNGLTAEDGKGDEQVVEEGETSSSKSIKEGGDEHDLYDPASDDGRSNEEEDDDDDEEEGGQTEERSKEDEEEDDEAGGQTEKRSNLV